MSNPFIGELRIMAFGFPPKGWALCNGQRLQINQNQVLFALLGTTFGGDGVRTFGLPDLQGRVPISWGNDFPMGEQAGEYAHTLTRDELPAHRHIMQGKDAKADTPLPAPTASVAQGHVADPSQAPVNIFGTGAINRTFAQGALSSIGNDQPHQNTQPYLALNICIALQGIFPSRT